MLEFSNNKIAGEVEVNHKLSEKDIETIIVNGFEGSIDYWAGLDRHVNSHWLEDKPKDEPLSTWATKALIEGKNIILYDKEDPDEVWHLTLENLINGFKLNYNNRAWDNVLETGDAETYDCIIQYALFEEIVYG